MRLSKELVGIVHLTSCLAWSLCNSEIHFNRDYRLHWYRLSKILFQLRLSWPARYAQSPLRLHRQTTGGARVCDRWQYHKCLFADRPFIANQKFQQIIRLKSRGSTLVDHKRLSCGRSLKLQITVIRRHPTNARLYDSFFLMLVSLEDQSLVR